MEQGDPIDLTREESCISFDREYERQPININDKYDKDIEGKEEEESNDNYTQKITIVN